MRRLIDIGYTEDAATALYGNYTTLAVPFVGLCISLITPITVAALPKLSTAYSSGDLSVFRDNLKHTITLSSALSALLGFGCMYFSREALSFIFSDASAEIAAPYLSMLSPSFMLFGALVAVNTALEAAGKTVAPLVSMAVGAVFKIVTGYILIGNENIGIGGAPIGTTVFYAVSLLVSLIILFYRVGVGVSFFTPMFFSVVNAELAALCAKVVQELTNKTQSTVIHTVLIGGIYAFLYLVLSRITTFRHKRREKTGNFAQKDNKYLLQET